ncbi:MAG: ABC transporter ATP-binding protein [Actinomycetota bacterium]|nr:ABC transporter ATP-binding protein [Actinomycetota bacterium]
MSVAVSGLYKSYPASRRDEEPVPALRGVELDAEQAELFVIVGPSGSGKSTLLRTIAGLERPDAGRVLIAGNDVTRTRPGDRDVAMVFQEYALYPHVTVNGNISFALRARKLASSEIARRVATATELLGIGALLQRKPPELSGGERQRVALARAIVRDPKAFLLDEPLSNLDAELRARTRSDIRRLQRDLGKTMIYVTHDQIEAMTMGDRVAVLRAGRVEQVGTPIEIYDRPANIFVATFFGSPPMNMFPAELSPDHTRAATLGVRPEDVSLVGEDFAKLFGEVTLVETIGSEAIVHVALEHGRFMVKVVRPDAPAMTDKVGLNFPEQALHVFDSDGQRM